MFDDSLNVNTAIVSHLNFSGGVLKTTRHTRSVRSSFYAAVRLSGSGSGSGSAKANRRFA